MSHGLIHQLDRQSITKMESKILGQLIWTLVDNDFIIERTEKPRQNNFGFHLSKHLSKESLYKALQLQQNLYTYQRNIRWRAFKDNPRFSIKTLKEPFTVKIHVALSPQHQTRTCPMQLRLPIEKGIKAKGVEVSVVLADHRLGRNFSALLHSKE